MPKAPGTSARIHIALSRRKLVSSLRQTRQVNQLSRVLISVEQCHSCVSMHKIVWGYKEIILIYTVSFVTSLICCFFVLPYNLCFHTHNVNSPLYYDLCLRDKQASIFACIIYMNRIWVSRSRSTQSSSHASNSKYGCSKLENGR